MESQDIIQEFANKQTTETTVEPTNILQEYVNSLNVEQKEETPIEPVIEQIAEPIADVSNETIESDNLVELNISESEVTEDEVLDESDFIKTRTGGKYSSWEEVEQHINKEKEVEKLGEFENETSRSIYNMLAEGKIAEVTELLQKKAFSESLKDKTDEDVLKAYIKQKNPEFDSQDVEDEYNEKYLIDEYSFDDAKLRREQKKLTQRIKGDVSEAKDYFSQSSEDIKFPKYEVSKQIAEETNDTEDAELQVERDRFLSSLDEIKNNVSSLPFNWKDEKTNMSVNGKFEIPAQELTKYQKGAENLEGYLAERYYQEGKYKSEQLLKDLYIADNFNKIINSVVSQAVNQTRLEVLKKSKNITVDTEQSATYRPSDADEEKNMFDKLFSGHLTRQQ
jgi:hypothetical protein